FSDSVHILINSTISGNTASRGGGLLVAAANLFRALYNCTVTLNQAASMGGGDGVFAEFPGFGAALNNSIVAGNGMGEDIIGLFFGEGNLIGNPAFSAGINNPNSGYIQNILGDGSGHALDIQTDLNTTLAN